jgi:hypothetical protein
VTSPRLKPGARRADAEPVDDLEEAVENINILVREGMDVQHQLEGHPTPIAACPSCARHAPSPS